MVTQITDVNKLVKISNSSEHVAVIDRPWWNGARSEWINTRLSIVSEAAFKAKVSSGKYQDSKDKTHKHKENVCDENAKGRKDR